MKFEWIDENSDIGHYRLHLIDDDGRKLEDISITDYTCDFHQQYDKKNRYTRPYSFEVKYRAGWSEGFDYDDEYYDHRDKDGRHIGGFQGVCTHTLEDIRNLCENFIAQSYMKGYYNTLKELETQKRRVEWFENQGFTLEENYYDA